jgi:dipeptidyl aminopeptidase/acylaminoacyl peptidase
MKKPYSLAAWLIFTLVVVALCSGSGLLRFDSFSRGESSRSKAALPGNHPHERREVFVENEVPIITAPAGAQKNETNKPVYLFDRSPVGKNLLVSRSRSEADGGQGTKGETLWLQDETGNERLVANGVVAARFSPDGGKIAYATDSYELYVETLAGESLAHVSRARDPSWRADSGAVGFLAIPALDYPDIRSRHLVYDLKSGQVTQAPSNE